MRWSAFPLILLLVALTGAACDADRESETAPTSSQQAAGAPPAPARTPIVTPAPPAELRIWVAITDQRRDVLELRVDDIRGILSGAITDWAQLGGSPLPVSPYVANGDEAAVAAALGLDPTDLEATRLAPGVLVSTVERTEGALALVAPSLLRPGVLALVVDGHDPYGDPALDSPLRLEAVGQPPTPQIEPALVLLTGEFIPARCTNLALETIEDFDAMFDGVRDLLQHADIVATALEVPLTDVGPPTPCLRTFTLQGRAEAADAVLGSGIDVMFPIGNHMLDCWDGCSGADAMLDTLERLNDGGVLTAGAGATLEDARRPAVIEVGSGGDALTVAFLGFDLIAPWYGAGAATPGIALFDPEVVADDVARARKTADLVVVALNWGVEYTADPTLIQREAAHIAIRAGASIVVGNHPHWVQALEPLDGALIAYALGNFVFDQSWSVETTESAILEASFTSDGMIGYRIRPVVLRGLEEDVRPLYRPELVDPAGEGLPVLQRMWDASDRLEPLPEPEPENTTEAE